MPDSDAPLDGRIKIRNVPPADYTFWLGDTDDTHDGFEEYGYPFKSGRYWIRADTLNARIVLDRHSEIC